MPYREDKPLAELIPPDRRRARTAALVAIGMVAGAGLFYGVQRATADAPTVTSNAQRTPPAVLHGPDGDVSFPPRGSFTIVHVWLQGCLDCMPAFEAIKKHEEDGRYRGSARVVNVAYGPADPAWAAQHGVRTNLVFDHGGNAVVRPLDIATFTTLVYDPNGSLVARDRPDREGYAERIRALVDPGPLTAREIEEVVATKHGAIRDACWRTRRDLEQAEATVSAVVAGDGSVMSTTSRGTDGALAACLEREVKRWRFRATGGASVTVDIPFKLLHDE